LVVGSPLRTRTISTSVIVVDWWARRKLTERIPMDTCASYAATMIGGVEETKNRTDKQTQQCKRNTTTGQGIM
jgi:hypothetical protein